MAFMGKLSIAAAILFCITAPATVLLADDTVTLHSADGQYQLVVPTGWGPADFHVQNIQISASDPHLRRICRGRRRPQDDYAGSLPQFAEAKRDTMAMSLDNPRLSSIQPIKMHGQDAFRFEIHGQLPDRVCPSATA